MAVEFVHVEGLEAAVRSLNALEPALVGKNGGPVLFALRRAAKIIKEQAQANIRQIVLDPNKDGEASRSTGALEKSIVVKRIKPLGGAKGEAVLIGIRRGKKQRYADSARNRRKGRAGGGYAKDSPTYYGKMLEGGTAKMAPHPWLLPAFDSRKQQALNEFARYLSERIAAIVKQVERENGARQ